MNATAEMQWHSPVYGSFSLLTGALRLPVETCTGKFPSGICEPFPHCRGRWFLINFRLDLPMGSLRSQPAQQIGEIVFHQQDLIRHISKHRRSFIH